VTKANTVLRISGHAGVFSFLNVGVSLIYSIVASKLPGGNSLEYFYIALAAVLSGNIVAAALSSSPLRYLYLLSCVAAILAGILLGTLSWVRGLAFLMDLV
jgi:hypothetical protein